MGYFVSSLILTSVWNKHVVLALAIKVWAIPVVLVVADTEGSMGWRCLNWQCIFGEHHSLSQWDMVCAGIGQWEQLQHLSWERIPFKMNYVLEINYLLRVCCIGRVCSLYLRGLTRYLGFCEIGRDLKSWRNYKFSSSLEVCVSLILVYTCLHLIRDRPWSDLVGCVHAESAAETNSFVKYMSRTQSNTSLWNALALGPPQAGESLWEAVGRSCSSLLVKAFLTFHGGSSNGAGEVTRGFALVTFFSRSGAASHMSSCIAVSIRVVQSPSHMFLTDFADAQLSKSLWPWDQVGSDCELNICFGKMRVP